MKRFHVFLDEAADCDLFRPQLPIRYPSRHGPETFSLIGPKTGGQVKHVIHLPFAPWEHDPRFLGILISWRSPKEWPSVSFLISPMGKGRRKNAVYHHALIS